MSLCNNLTAKLYQSGLELEDAVKKGANRKEFEALEEQFRGGSIPLHIFVGFKYQKPYSCSYHSGPAFLGELVRQINRQGL